jgi:hypothetical protein
LKIYKIPGILLLIPLLSSCFKEDVPIQPHGGEVLSLKESIYTHQSYFELATKSIVSVNPVDAWDLCFEASPTGWHIRINSGRYLGIYASGTTDFNGLTSIPLSAKWKFDKSDGNSDSTAVGKWISDDLSTPSNEVYVLGINDGVKYVPYKKIVFLSLVSGAYSFRFSDLNGSNTGTFNIIKDPSRNFVYFSFVDGGKTVPVEPKKDKWDIVFTQYTTTLYTSENVPTPYFVRGGLSNPNGVEVALDSLTGYENITIADISTLSFSSKADAIGYDWKAVKIQDVTASYSIRDNYTYLLKGVTGDYYKFRFRGFYNDAGSPGYPRFEVSILQ